MPASRSPNRDARSDHPRRAIWPWFFIAASAVLVVIAAALPASFVRYFLPAAVHAEDFSGTLWHGSAGKITVYARDAGALEWRLRAPALLRLAVEANLHWVKGGFAIDADANVDRQGFAASHIVGGGPLDDLHEIGIAPAWRGTAALKLSEVKGGFSRLSAAVGSVSVSNLTSPQVADGADLGGYELRLLPGAVAGDGSVSAMVHDTGGPLEAVAQLRVSPSERTGLLTGTLAERPNAPQNLRTQLDSLTQLRGRDAKGRIPVDLEFTF